MERRKSNILKAQVNVFFEDIVSDVNHYQEAIKVLHNQIVYVENLLKDEDIISFIKSEENRELFILKMMDCFNLVAVKVANNQVVDIKTFNMLFERVEKIFWQLTLFSDETNNVTNKYEGFLVSIPNILHTISNSKQFLDSLNTLLNINYNISVSTKSICNNDLFPLKIIRALFDNTKLKTENKLKNDYLIETLFNMKNISLNTMNSKEFVFGKFVLNNDYIFKMFSTQEIEFLNKINKSTDKAEHVITNNIILKAITIRDNQIFLNTKIFNSNKNNLEVMISFFIPNFLKTQNIKIDCLELDELTGEMHNVKFAGKRAVFIYNFEDNHEYLPIIHNAITNTILNGLSNENERLYNPFSTDMNMDNFKTNIKQSIHQYDLEKTLNMNDKQNKVKQKI